MYAQNLVDYHLVIDLVPEIAKLYFTNKLGENFSLSLVQAVIDFVCFYILSFYLIDFLFINKAILVALGLQHKSVEDLEKELQLPPNQVLAMFNKIVKKIIALLEDISVNQMNKLLFSNGTEKVDKKMEPLKQSLEEELNEASKKVKKDEAQKKKELMSSFDLKQYEIKGNENEWSDALKLPATTSYVTVKR